MPQAYYFIQLACILRDSWLKVDRMICEESLEIETFIDDAVETLMYIQDIFEIAD